MIQSVGCAQCIVVDGDLVDQAIVVVVRLATVAAPEHQRIGRLNICAADGGARRAGGKHPIHIQLHCIAVSGGYDMVPLAVIEWRDRPIDDDAVNYPAVPKLPIEVQRIGVRTDTLHKEELVTVVLGCRRIALIGEHRVGVPIGEGLRGVKPQIDREVPGTDVERRIIGNGDVVARAPEIHTGAREPGGIAGRTSQCAIVGADRVEGAGSGALIQLPVRHRA